ncbi:type IV secretion system DNA-binding domain-containing protein [Candidatus Micrarchaeota archaeon]|nr:type IV secretion system DNA-binding domain-containing protein [Candidatus Micrarchaeota archaeon]
MNFDLQSIQLIIPANLLESFNWSVFISTFLIVLLASLSIILVYFLTKLFFEIRYLKQSPVFLEVKPLSKTEQSSYSTQQLFNLIHSITQQRTIFEKLLGLEKRISLEIVSTKEEGICYLIRCDEESSELLSKSLLSYLPGVKIEKTKDYLPDELNQSSITEFDLSNHFAYPLKSHDNLDKNDPIAYLTGSMTKLKEGDLLTYQIVATPLKKHSKPDISRISKLIYSRKDLVHNIGKNNGFKNYLRFCLGFVLQLLLLPVGLFVFVASEGKEGPLLPLPLLDKKDKSSNPYQQELEKLIKQKLEQPLFNISLRILVNTENNLTRRRGIISTIRSISSSNYQSLNPVFRIRWKPISKLKTFLFTNRLNKPFNKTILSAAELGDLYHFPFTKTTKTEDLQKQYSKELPTPVSLKRAKDLDVVFAENHYGGNTTQIGLTEDERRRHVYILGGTGTGKSTMLLSMINFDLKNNKGLAVIDPHGDLIDQILNIIPQERIKDVVYFNPDDIGYPIGINVLELSEGLDGDEALREKEFITESVISLFHKVYTEKYSGPRLEYILRNTIHTAFTVPGATLFTVNKLLVNPRFRKSVVKKLTDENLKDFWKYEFAKSGDYQKVKMILPITNKIGRFLFSPTAKRILEQEKSTVDFDLIMNEGKILFCNLSKGKIGEDNSKVFGAVMMAKLQLAAMKRARIPSENRKDFYLYVDEFQNFATPSFAQILSEARKYRLNAVLAHQTTSQLEDKSLVNVTLANTGTVICFRTANPEDEKLILPQFRPYIEEGEIASLPSYRFYMRLGALNPEEPFSGITVPVEIKENKQRTTEVIENSRKYFARKYEVQEKRLKMTKFITSRTKQAAPNILP